MSDADLLAVDCNAAEQPAVVAQRDGDIAARAEAMQPEPSSRRAEWASEAIDGTGIRSGSAARVAEDAPKVGDLIVAGNREASIP